MPILIDTSQLIHGYGGDEIKKGNDKETMKMILRGHFFNMVHSYLTKYRKKYGEPIFCCDGGNYWRKEFFPAYKGHRKYSKAESDVDYGTMYEVLDEVVDSLEEVFPYRVIKYDSAEADDVIAVLTKYFNENEMISEGVLEEIPQPVLIITSDSDSYQLHKYKNVAQWSIRHKKFVKPEIPPLQYLNEHIASGDGGDNFPNILTHEQWAIDRSNGIKPARQKSLMSARLQGFIKNGKDECMNDEERRRWDQNEILASFEKIPQKISDAILTIYNSTGGKKPNRNQIFNYFVKNRMKMMIQNVGDF